LLFGFLPPIKLSWEREYQTRPGANVKILCGVAESLTWWLNGRIHPVSSSNSDWAICCSSRIRPLGIDMATRYYPALLISLLEWRTTALLLTQRTFGGWRWYIRSILASRSCLKHQLAFTHVLWQRSKVLSPVLHSILKSVKLSM